MSFVRTTRLALMLAVSVAAETPEMDCDDYWAYGTEKCTEEDNMYCGAECFVAMEGVLSTCKAEDMDPYDYFDEAMDRSCRDASDHMGNVGMVTPGEPHECFDKCVDMGMGVRMFSLTMNGTCICHKPGGCEGVRVNGSELFGIQYRTRTDVVTEHKTRCERMADSRCWWLFYAIEDSCFEHGESSLCEHKECVDMKNEGLEKCTDETWEDKDNGEMRKVKDMMQNFDDMCEECRFNVQRMSDRECFDSQYRRCDSMDVCNVSLANALRVCTDQSVQGDHGQNYLLRDVVAPYMGECAHMPGGGGHKMCTRIPRSLAMKYNAVPCDHHDDDHDDHHDGHDDHHDGHDDRK